MLPLLSDSKFLTGEGGSCEHETVSELIGWAHNKDADVVYVLS